MENWLKRLFNRIFNEDIHEEVKDEYTSLRPGRFPSSEHEENARVIHQYPKTGNFRFPLIPDDEQPGSVERTSRRHSEKQERQARSEREKFTGVNFKASDVPSPVYGFRTRTDKSSERYQNDGSSETENAASIEAVRDCDEKPTEEPLTSIPAVVEQALDEQQMDHEIESESLIESTVQQKNEERERSRQTVIESSEQIEKSDVQMTDPLTENSHDHKQTPEIKQNNVMPFTAERQRTYYYPKLTLLDKPLKKQTESDEWLQEQKNLLNETLKNFNVRALVTNVVKGPTVTRFEVQPKPGVKVSKITNLTDDIKLNLSAKEIRIEAPIPGKNAIGIEVPNRMSQPVALRDILESSSFQEAHSPLSAALGVDITGKPVVTDLKKMPHGLIAGATGSGKSVCINSILTSILYKANPDDVKLMLIDPKVVELAPYNDLPHLVTPVITDVKEATAALKWAVDEMEERYKKFANTKVRDIERYNENVSDTMPYIVVIIDELADLMMVSPQEVEDAICRIAQKARACGIHLLVATQRPSVDVITGLIKANIPTRIAFSVSSQVDSRTILDSGGAEKLLGKGDMLFLENGASKPVRLQGNFVSDGEIERITDYIKRQRKPNYLIEAEDLSSQTIEQFEDELFYEACEFIFEQGAASSSSLQRRFRIGYNRAARLIDMMEDHGLVSKANGSKPRKLLMTKQEFNEAVQKVSGLNKM